jgi:hypothetical protein
MTAYKKVRNGVKYYYSFKTKGFVKSKFQKPVKNKQTNNSLAGNKSLKGKVWINGEPYSKKEIINLRVKNKKIVKKKRLSSFDFIRAHSNKYNEGYAYDNRESYNILRKNGYSEDEAMSAIGY